MANTDTLPQLLTIDQLADRLGISIRHVRRLIAESRRHRRACLDGAGTVRLGRWTLPGRQYRRRHWLPLTAACACTVDALRSLMMPTTCRHTDIAKVASGESRSRHGKFPAPQFRQLRMRRT